MGDADHGLRALLYPNLHGKNFPTAVWLGPGVDTGRERGRHAAPAVVGRFIFFRDLAFFGNPEDSCFAGQDGDGRNRAPPLKPPGSSNRKSPKILSPIFFGDFKKEREL